MKDILEIIAENKRKEIKSLFPKEFEEPLNFDLKNLPVIYSLKKRIETNPGGIIAEFKRRSPSKGEISPMADVDKITRDYVRAGAAGLSILTDTRFFGGAISDLAVAHSIAKETPVLRKDFIISRIQIKEARITGASAILLIASILSEKELKSFYEYAHSLGMECLVEIHNERELEKITFKPDLLGVNNRNLSSFHTDLNHSVKIARKLPEDVVLVAESGIKHPEDIIRLRGHGYKGFLIGEAFMTTSNPGETLINFINAIS